MPYRIRHPDRGYYSGANNRREMLWSPNPDDARIMATWQGAKRRAAKIPGAIVEPFEPSGVTVVTFTSVEAELIGVPCGGFGEVVADGDC